MNAPHWITPTSHPLCAGPGCNTCARHENELNERRAQLRDRRDRVGLDAIERALAWLSHENPDLVNEALDQTGAPS